MILFGSLPAPLRPTAVRLLAAVFPYIRPASLDGVLGEMVEQQRDAFTSLTRGWTAEHWDRLSEALLPPGDSRRISTVGQAMRQVAFEFHIERVPFRVFDAGPGKAPPARAPAGSLGLASDVLRLRMKEAADAVAQDEAERKIQAAEDRILAEERERSARLALECQSWLGSQRSTLSIQQKELSLALNRSVVLSAERRQLLADLAQNLRRAETYAQLGEQELAKLSALQEQRRQHMDLATQGDRPALQAVVDLDARCDQLLTVINRLRQHAEEIVRTIDSCNEQVTATETGHREQAEKPFDQAQARIETLIRETETLLATLTRHADADIEWNRIADRLRAEGSNAEKLRPQYLSLGLWQLSTAPDHAEKKAAARAAERLRADAAAAIGGSRRLVLE